MKQALETGVEPKNLSIPDSFVHRFGRAPRDQAYWVLWSQEAMPIAYGGRFPENKKVSELSPFPPSPLPKGPRLYQSSRIGRTMELMLNAGNRRLLIARPMAKEFDALGVLAIRLLGCVMASIGVAAFIAIWVSKRIATPISELAIKTRELTHERLNERLQAGRSTREVQELASAFNAMLHDLQSAFEKQKRFTADAAHELRTPVSVMLAQSEHCLARTRSEPEYRGGFETMRSTAIRMRELVQNLLQLAVIDDGQFHLQMDSVDLAMVGNQAIEMMLPIAAEKSITLCIESTTVAVRGDKLRLRQVLLNLLSNAIQYSEAGTRVDVVILDGDQYAELIVRDEGMGIVESEQALVWNRFHRVDLTRTVSFEATQDIVAIGSSGAGLGLSLVSELVRLHGGHIEMVSTPGVGTAVKIQIPKAAVDFAKEPAAI